MQELETGKQAPRFSLLAAGERPVGTVLEVIGRNWIPQSVFDDSRVLGGRADCL